jgi:phosphoglycerol transferase
MGGFSSLIGLVYAELRAWNRLSIFIAFFAFLAVAVALDRARPVVSRWKHGRVLFAVVLSAVFVGGALDQTSEAYVPAYGETANQYWSDRAFVRQVEDRLPDDASVFELPYASFPEEIPPPPGRTVVYDLLRPYLHSRGLRWSFGAMYGRPADWSARLADQSLAEVVPIVSAVGFDAIYVDRLGYVSDAAANAAERELVKIVGSPPLRSEDGRLLVFDLRAYNERLRSRLGPAELARLRARALRDT